MVVGAGPALGLLLVDAPEALAGAGVHELAHVPWQLPLGGAGLEGQGLGAHAALVVEANCLQGFVVAVPARVVDVEPGGPLGA